MTPQTRTPSPTTARALAHFTRGLKSFEHTEFSMAPREDVEGQFCNATIVYRANGDVIFQLFPRTKKFPAGAEAGREFLADALEVYFDSLDRFSASYVHELSSWAVRAELLAETPTYNREHHVYGFLSYLNQALADL